MNNKFGRDNRYGNDRSADDHRRDREQREAFGRGVDDGAQRGPEQEGETSENRQPRDENYVNRGPREVYAGRPQQGAYGASSYGASSYGSSGIGGPGYGGGAGYRGSSDYSDGLGFGDSSGSSGRPGSTGRSGYGSPRGDTGFAPSLGGAARGGEARGGHSGRGPKGYQRSDDRIREDVSDRLSWNDEVDATEISVLVTGGEVTLEGSVPTRHMKRLAEDIAEEVSGVKDVHNTVRVTKPMLTEIKEKLTGEGADEHHANTGTKTSSAGELRTGS